MDLQRQETSGALFAFLYVRDAACLTSPLNAMPKQLSITAGSFTGSNSFYSDVE